MPIRFTFDGASYTCDTAKEAAELRKLLGRQRRRQQKSNDVQGPKPVQQPFTSFREAGVRPSVLIVRIVHALLDGPTAGMESDILAEKVGIGPKSLPPVIGHLNTLIDRAGYAPKSILERHVLYDKGRAKSLYALTSLGREVAPRLIQSAA
jgi:hypothetical protein